MTIELLTSLLGWMVVLNFAFLAIAATILFVADKPIMRLHGQISKLPEGRLRVIYFEFLAWFKLLAILLTLSPYLALKLMGY
jgi:hypothetical protein